MPHIVLPVLDASAAIDIDCSAAPVDPAAAPPSAAAPIAAGGPAPQRVGRAKGHASGDDASANVARIAPVVGISRIVGVRPIAKNHLRFVVGNVNAVGRCRLNVDKLSVLVLIYSDLLFVRRDQL